MLPALSCPSEIVLSMNECCLNIKYLLKEEDNVKNAVLYHLQLRLRGMNSTFEIGLHEKVQRNLPPTPEPLHKLKFVNSLQQLRRPERIETEASKHAP